ncbi:MAG: phosphoglycerate mutase, 2,3-bisphosphoglycerate-independent [Candidatus Berkelbacteria bacterium]|nr:phosphoglycerate mutase, 2,3-bisphosphoglycerate-independent [Candidatus Berkelbacteria bacterium]
MPIQIWVDICLGKVVKQAMAKNIVCLITADHGNAEQMINPNTGEPHTEHTISPVPFVLISENSQLQNPLKDYGIDNILACVSPTILKIMGMEIPQEMTGKSLIE